MYKNFEDFKKNSKSFYDFIKGSPDSSLSEFRSFMTSVIGQNSGQGLSETFEKKTKFAVPANIPKSDVDILDDFIYFLDAYITAQAEDEEALSDATSANALSAALRAFRSKED
jgi:hypothetical protein